MNTTIIANIAIATLALVEDGLRKIIYNIDRLQEKLELHKLAVINNERRKADVKLHKLRLALSELGPKRTLELNAINAKAKAERLALEDAERQQVDKLGIANTALLETHGQYVKKAVSRGWVA